MAKEFVSIKETALLLNCSDGHIRNLVGKAQKGKASHPIPFLDLDGVTVFPRVKLLEWARQPRRSCEQLASVATTFSEAINSWSLLSDRDPKKGASDVLQKKRSVLPLRILC
jgi:hypothetical protein